MTRLEREHQRLFPAQHAGPAGNVRTLRLGVPHAGGWSALSAVWQGVQAELDLPPPAIEIDGAHGYALWFALSQPVPATQAEQFLQGLQARWLSDLPASQVQLHAGTPPELPPALRRPDQWSAFVTRDLAPIFGDTPWLDTPPNPEGQADLLSGLRGIEAEAWHQALATLTSVTTSPTGATASAAQAPSQAAASTTLPPSLAIDAQGPFDDPRQFLMAVMNDVQTPLALRIDAAKALLT